VILAFIESDGNELDDASAEALTFGRKLAEEAAGPFHALFVGAEEPPDLAEIAEFGITTLHHARDERLDAFAPAAWARALTDVTEQLEPQVVIAPGTDHGNEVMAHVAARMGLPMAANVIEATSGDPFLVTRLRWGGSLLEEASLEPPVKLMTIAPHALQPQQAGAPTDLVVEIVEPAITEEDLHVRVLERVPPDPGRVSLAEARVVVGGGRGVGGTDAFAILEELADLLGGAVGVSRVVTSNGWRPHADQIGQTGMRIAPDLYIACGISGAIQHMVGCKAAKRILAINTDREAPIMARAEYAVIGDLHGVVPAICEEIRKLRGDR
jgi:electron transfer flavoprotein alpha subunit